MSTQPHLPIVGYLPARHDTSCAVFDPVPDHCDCGALPVPLVRLSDARNAVRAAEQAAKATPQGAAHHGR